MVHSLPGYARIVSLWFVAGTAVGCGTDDGRRESTGERPPAPESEIYRLERIADDVFATVVQEGVSPSRFAASLIVIRDDDVVVVDSRHDGESAQELIDTVASLTDLPVGYVVNTHWHGDHVQGNQRFREVFPGVRLVAGATTGEDMRTLGRTRLDEEIVGVDERVAAAEGWLESGTGPDGGELTPEQIEGLPAQIRSARDYAAARRSIELLGPEVVVENVLRLEGPGLTVEVELIGPAHTRGDVVVRVPERGVLAIGDLIEDGFPYFGDGYPSGWADAMDRIEDMSWTTVLGAHGPVLIDRRVFETQRRFVRRIVETAAAAAAAGVEEPGGDFAEFQSHFTARLASATDAERAERYAAFVEDVFARALAEANGELEEGS